MDGPTSTDSARSAGAPRSASHSTSELAPLGVKLICVLSAVLHLVWFVPVLELVVAGGLLTVFGLVAFATNVGSFVLYYGLLTLQSWAYKAFLVVETLGLFYFVVNLSLLGSLLSIFTLGYVWSYGELYK